MHGRSRKAAPTPEEEAASAAKALELRSLQSLFMSNHHQKIYTQEAIQLSAKLLEINPEAYTAWNYRKLAVEYNLSRIDDSDPTLINSILHEELELVKKALKRNPKSYGAWYHRKWVLSKTHSLLENELELLNENQKLDLRNFHAWNHRRFVVALTKTSEEDELHYTTNIINDNFSNYSAWHNRSVVLSKKADGFMAKETIRCEYDYVNKAIFTDEDAQSCWFYYLWLLDQTVKTVTPLVISSLPSSDGSIHDTVEGIVSWKDGFDNWDAKDLISLNQLNGDMDFGWRKKAIEREIESYRKLPDSKIGKLILAKLLMAKESMNSVKGVHYKEILQLYKDLMVLDSTHEQYYKDEHSVALVRQVVSSTESLSRHLFRYRDMVCLRLNSLTLTRITGVEKLLFVQMLDLSDNELHSAEGLEAMQILCCVNLSKNRIRSFSALESLRRLKQLRVLDVSHNHICKQPVRYFLGEIGREVPSKYWDAYLVLSDLTKLKQLDIKGNELIVGEEFSSFVRQVVPKLVWLDGQKLA